MSVNEGKVAAEARPFAQAISAPFKRLFPQSRGLQQMKP